MIQPIELHYWPTPNGIKVSLALEEMGLPYTLFSVNIGKGEQFDPAFLAISPNNRITSAPTAQASSRTSGCCPTA
jgi:GST-like protein